MDTIVAEAARIAWSVMLAVVPLSLFFLAFQLVLLELPRREVARVLGGTLIAALGLFLFLLGVTVGLLPFGRAIGEAMLPLGPWPMLALGLLLGFVTTWSEASVRILAAQVEEVSTGAIRQSLVLNAMCIGTAIAVGIGLLRVVYAIPLSWLLIPGYLVILAVMWVSDERYVAIAIDGGGVATGPLANTFLLSLALGASAAAGAKDPLVNGLGLVSLIAVAPVISIMVLGLVVRRKEHRKES